MQSPLEFASLYNSFINSYPWLIVEDGWSSILDANYGARCNICGSTADYVVQLELIRKRRGYNRLLHAHEMPFYLCRQHEYLYEKMKSNVELKDYFTETIKVNQ